MDGMEPQVGTGNDGGNEYEGGHNVPNTGVPMGYPEQVNTGQATGESSKRTEVARSNRWEPFTKKKGYITPRSQIFKKNHFVTSHFQRRNNDRGNDNRPDPNSEGQTSTKPDDLRCPRCKKYHPNRPCRAGLGVCYKCGKSGHIARDCPHKKRRVAVESDFHIRGNHELAVEFLTTLRIINICNIHL
ncbi:hypothetical protein Ahy_B01g052880 isoform B [Arachis hypogaea]|uniref:CCHC-type domain-containing protein n=2 Tax=Arachis hypogaea TaxID=3818 RepID=A0A445AQJ9_ARAHY|nr:hypothetical protein Ahy_B01g052880 isoform B [Arachis hypogaea]